MVFELAVGLSEDIEVQVILGVDVLLEIGVGDIGDFAREGRFDLGDQITADIGGI